jgi:hypothetical protein
MHRKITSCAREAGRGVRYWDEDCAPADLDTFGVHRRSFGDSTGTLEVQASNGSIAAFARVAS